MAVKSKHYFSSLHYEQRWSDEGVIETFTSSQEGIMVSIYKNDEEKQHLVPWKELLNLKHHER